MGYKFANSKSVVKIEIEDKVYPVRITKALGQKLSSISASDVSVENENSAAAYIDGLIDSILGKGKAAEIFSDRPVDLFERVDVLKYICGELTSAVTNFYV